MMYSIKKNIPQKIKQVIKRYFKDLKDSFIYMIIKQKRNDNFNKIIFVCKGNVCRSVFADLYFKKINTQNIHSVSCGIDVDQGSKPPNKAIQVGAEFGVDMNNNISKNINTLNLKKGDQIIAMECDQYKSLIKRYPQYKHNISLLKDYLPWPKKLECNIPDPFGGDVEEFRRCFHTIKRAVDRMVNELSDRHDKT